MPLGKKKENDDNDDDGCGKGWETGKEGSVHLFGFLLSLIFADNALQFCHLFID